MLLRQSCGLSYGAVFKDNLLKKAAHLIKPFEQLGCAVDHGAWGSLIQTVADSLAIRSVFAAIIKSLTCKPFI